MSIGSTWKVVAMFATLMLAGCFPHLDLQAGIAVTDEEVVSSCRSAFPDVAKNPGAPGGWLLSADKGLLCLYGTLEDVDAIDLQAALVNQGAIVNQVVVRSTGGPVDVWLVIAEALIAGFSTLVVDEACFSSCATYAVPPAKEVSLSESALIVWHGGPNNFSSSNDFGAHVISYAKIASRTENIYRKLGISTRLLRDTMSAPSSEQVQLVTRLAPSATQISGYAVSPERLRSCYGLKNLEMTDHPGGDAQVLETGLRFSNSLAILEFPDLNGVCEK